MWSQLGLYFMHIGNSLLEVHVGFLESPPHTPQACLACRKVGQSSVPTSQKPSQAGSPESNGWEHQGKKQLSFGD